MNDDCLSCPQPGGDEYPDQACAQSKRPCGHHCNHSWTHDICHWCDTEFGDEDASATCR